MAAGDFSKTFGKQRAVWAQPQGSNVFVGGVSEHIEAVVIELEQPHARIFSCSTAHMCTIRSLFLS